MNQPPHPFPLPMNRAGCGSQTISVRQVVCLERTSASLLPLLQKRRRGSGRGGRFLSVSPLSSSLPARNERGEREKSLRRFSCRTLLVTDPRSEVTGAVATRVV